VAGVTKDGGEGVPQGGTAHFTVDPDRVVKLRDDVKSIANDLQTYLSQSEHSFAMMPPGADPVSFDTADMFTGNGDRAMTAARAFYQRLKSFGEALDAAAKKYELADEEGNASFLSGRA
jgi:PE family protein